MKLRVALCCAPLMLPAVHAEEAPKPPTRVELASTSAYGVVQVKSKKENCKVTFYLKLSEGKTVLLIVPEDATYTNLAFELQTNDKKVRSYRLQESLVPGNPVEVTLPEAVNLESITRILVNDFEKQ